MPLATFPGLRNPRFHPLAQNLTLELGKDRQHPGQRPARGRGEIQGLMQRDKPHAQALQLVKCADQVR